MAAAQARVSGKVLSAALDNEDGKLVYRIDLPGIRRPRAGRESQHRQRAVLHAEMGNGRESDEEKDWGVAKRAMTALGSGRGEVLVGLRSIEAWRGGAKILSDVSLTVRAGEIYGLIGPNGAGKTTTLAVVVGLLAPTAGGVRILGLDPVGQAEAVRARTGVMPERGGFYDWMIASQYLAFFARLYGFDPSAVEIGERLASVGLCARLDRPIETFSHGMRQRLGLARALINDPSLLVLDEPTSGLDPSGRREIHELLLTLSHKCGIGILMSTHILDDAERLCDRIGIIAGGVTVIEGAVPELAKMGRDLGAPERAGGDRYRLRLADRGMEAASKRLPAGVSFLGGEGDWRTVALGSEDPPEMVWRELMFLGWPIREIQHLDDSDKSSGLERLYLELTKHPEGQRAA
jgi:ABC-2 type transport system ATP-binding protein